MDEYFESELAGYGADDSSETMDSAASMYTVCYLLVSACLVAPPTEFVTAGLTVQNVLSGVLGSEQMSYTLYHMKRTAATLIVHSLLPMGYYVGMALLEPHLHLWTVWRAGLMWRMVFLVSVTMPLCAIIFICHWSRGKWSNHPIAKTLALHASAGSSWRSVASSVNVEFRRFDKFSTGPPGRRLVVTDSWVMQGMTYSVYLAHQSDIHLTLDGSEHHEMSYESTHALQVLNITVRSVNPGVKPFKIRLNATEYSDLKDKLSAPIRNARNIVIRQSVNDLFLVAFKEQISRNPEFHKTPVMDLEPCIGCMMTRANVKLQKLCAEQDEGECERCFCRPMWCQDCMGKWFASRQDQNDTREWLSSQSPCPTCRAKFCVLDVCKVV